MNMKFVQGLIIFSILTIFTNKLELGRPVLLSEPAPAQIITHTPRSSDTIIAGSFGSGNFSDWSSNTAASSNLSANFTDVNNNPLRMTTTNNVAISAPATSFSEMMGLPDSQLDTIYWLPWYNNVDLDTQLRFGNVSDSTATVSVFIGGSLMNGSPFTLLPGKSTRVSFAGVSNGPVKIVSNVPIVAAERVILSS